MTTHIDSKQAVLRALSAKIRSNVAELGRKHNQGLDDQRLHLIRRTCSLILARRKLERHLRQLQRVN